MVPSSMPLSHNAFASPVLYKYRLVRNKVMEYIIQNKKYMNRIYAGSRALEESRIHVIHIIGGNRKDM